MGLNLLRRVSRLPLAAGVLCLGTLGMTTDALAAISIGPLQQTSIYIAERLKEQPSGNEARCNFLSVPITADSAGQPDVFVRIEESSPNLTQGLYADPQIHVGEVLPGQTRIVYFYLCADPSVTANVVNNPFTVHAYAANPSSSSAPAPILSSQRTVNIEFADTNASASKIYGTTLSPATSTWVGGTYTMAVTGTVGNVGADQRIVFSPTIFPSFRADLFELRSVRLEITGSGTLPAACQDSSGNAKITVDRLVCDVPKGWFSGANDGAFTITYTFVTTAQGPSSPATPLQYVDSGQNLKYPKTAAATLPPGYLPLLLNKDAAPDAFASAGGTTRYSVTVTNRAPGIAEFSDWVDTLPPGVAYAGSPTIKDSNGGSCGITTADFTQATTPKQSGQVLTWSHLFKIPAANLGVTPPVLGACTLEFNATIPAYSGTAPTSQTHTNCAVVWNLGTRTPALPAAGACADVNVNPPPQSGTITINKSTFPTNFNGTFNFTVTGPAPSTAESPLSVSTSNGVGTNSLAGLTAGS
ncbi:MAG: hypothetical protein IPG98_11305 [Burkholderiales bacterium]|nr:hypothetical protein [Burkholderiales bacterium]MBK8664828.1 hypothetical protein [Burkholderiales bacterium]